MFLNFRTQETLLNTSKIQKQRHILEKKEEKMQMEEQTVQSQIRLPV